MLRWPPRGSAPVEFPPPQSEEVEYGDFEHAGILLPWLCYIIRHKSLVDVTVEGP